MMVKTTNTSFIIYQTYLPNMTQLTYNANDMCSTVSLRIGVNTFLLISVTLSWVNILVSEILNSRYHKADAQFTAALQHLLPWYETILLLMGTFLYQPTSMIACSTRIFVRNIRNIAQIFVEIFCFYYCPVEGGIFADSQTFESSLIWRQKYSVYWFIHSNRDIPLPGIKSLNWKRPKDGQYAIQWMCSEWKKFVLQWKSHHDIKCKT